MTTLLLVILAMVTVGAAGFALVPSALPNKRAEQRIKAFQGDIRANRREADANRTRDNRRKNVQQALKAQTDELKEKKRISLPDLIFQAGMTIKPATFIRNSIIFGVVVFVVLVIAQVPFYFAAIFGVAGGYLLPRMYVKRKRAKYQDRFLDELPNAIEAIVRGIKTGLPLNEVNFLVVVISVQQQSGGNLSEALGNLARVLRNRKKMKQKVKAMSSEAKASAGIIGALPFVVAILVSLVTPTYLLPLFTTPIGNICLGIGVLMLSVGIFVMSRMVKFEV
jgi:tight adherence protein B